MIKGDLLTGHLLAGAILILAAACSSPNPPAPSISSRPVALQRVQPAKQAIVLTRARPLAIEAPQQRHKTAFPATPVNLPKPLLAEVITPEEPLQCVPFARSLSGLQIRGDAWTWWDQAEGRFRRGQLPEPGAVMVLKRKGRSRGHVAHVDEIVHRRMIIVSHANWLNDGRIHKNIPVLDVSKANDWSAIRVWHTPGGHFGGRVYNPYGFIYNNTAVASAD